MGEILGFIVDCLGVPREKRESPVKKNSYLFKDLQRLKKGGLSPEKYWAVTHKIIVSILAMFTDDVAAHETIKKIFLKKLFSRPQRDWIQMPNGLWLPVTEREPLEDQLQWKFNKQGEIINFQERFVLDWLEFLERNEFLLKHTPPQKRTPELIALWTSIYALPFFAYNLIEYLSADASFESGMPGGVFWYLPEIAIAEDRKGFEVSQWPVSKVMEWWEDLVGESFHDNPRLLFPTICEAGLDDAKRQIRFWRYEDRTPDPETIFRWCKQNWAEKYKGVFTDDLTLPLHERWNRCRAFLVKKSLHETHHNWVAELPEPIRSEYQAKRYRGETLELQILRFWEYSFAEIFASPDPIAQGMPIEELIHRVAKRYAQPTNNQLKCRLLFAATIQRAILLIEKNRGRAFAAMIFGTYKELHDYLMDLENSGVSLESKMKYLQATPQAKLKLRYACEWLFDKRCFFELPSLLAHRIRPK